MNPLALLRRMLARATTPKAPDAPAYRYREIPESELMDVLAAAHERTRDDLTRNKFLPVLTEAAERPGARLLELLGDGGPFGVVAYGPENLPGSRADRYVDVWMNYAPTAGNFPASVASTLRADSPSGTVFRAVPVPELEPYYRKKGFKFESGEPMYFKARGGLARFKDCNYGR